MALNNCKVTYFASLPGRAEAIRLALAIGGFKFTDERIQRPEWATLKPTTPWGSLPTLTLSSGAQIGQSRAALRYIGNEIGFYPIDPFEAAKVESVIDVWEDILTKTNAEGRGLPQEEKESARAAVVSKGGAVYTLFEKLEKFISENGSNGHCVGKSMTIADLFLFSFAGQVLSGFFDGIPTNALDTDFPNIMQVRKNVRNHQAVSKWYSELDKSIPTSPSYGPFN